MPPVVGGKSDGLDDSVVSSTLGDLYDSVTGIKPHSSTLHRLMDKTMHLEDGEASEDSDDDDAALQDDGLSSSSDEELEDAMDTDVLADHRNAARSPEMMTAVTEDYPKTGAPPSKQSSAGDQVPKTAGLLTSSIKSQRLPARQASLPGHFERPGGHHSESSIATPGSSIPPTPGTSTPGGSKRRPIFKKQKSQMSSRKSTKDFNFDASKGKDTLGIVVMEILSASDLPRIKNCEHLSPCAVAYTAKPYGWATTWILSWSLHLGKKSFERGSSGIRSTLLGERSFSSMFDDMKQTTLSGSPSSIGTRWVLYEGRMSDSIGLRK